MRFKSAVFFASFWAASSSSPISSRDIPFDNVEAAYSQLQSSYSQSSGLWPDQSRWWQSANCLTMLAKLASIDQNLQQDIQSVISNTYNQAQNSFQGFVDEYNDDNGWWALGWIQAYDLTGEEQYLSTAESLFNDMRQGFGKTSCSSNDGGQGGILWSKDGNTYVAAIANELFLTVGAYLANRVKNGNANEYLDLAKQQWDWFRASGMINQQGTINDGLDDGCRNNGSRVRSYNQGAILGGLVALHSSASSNSEYLDSAHSIANAAISQLATNNGILQDPCEAEGSCDSDQTQFKGIFVRNLLKLQQVDPQNGGQYADFIRRNADSIWQNNRQGDAQLGLNWAGPAGTDVGPSTQSSAMDALVAALSL